MSIQHEKDTTQSTKNANVTNDVSESITTPSEVISQKPTRRNLLKFALPTILSTLIMSTFGIVDGIFVSRLIDPIALAAVSIVFPFLGFSMAIGFMLGIGGNAMIAKKLGEGLGKESRENFSLITMVAFIVSILISFVGIAFPDFVLNILGTDASVRDMALEYMLPLLWFMPAIILGMVFNQFLITVGKAHYSAVTALIGGVTSASLNFLFIYVMEMGLQGAALATSIGYTLPAIVGLIYFTFERNGTIYFVMPRLDFRALGRTCINGASEMVTMLAASFTTVIMNNVLMDLNGPEAVAASGIMFAGVGIFTALFVGYASGVAPIISYNYGKNDTTNLKQAYSNSLFLIGILSAISIALAILGRDLLISIYDVPRGTPIYEMAATGFIFLASSFIFMGFNAFASMFFTALNNGVVSSILSFFRTLVFVVIAFMILPTLFGLTGAWLAMPVAEVLAIVMTIVFFKKMKKTYNYA